MTDAVAEALVVALDGDDLTVPEVMKALRASGARVPRARVEATLAADDRFAADGPPHRPRWRHVAAPPPTVTTTRDALPAWTPPPANPPRSPAISGGGTQAGAAPSRSEAMSGGGTQAGAAPSRSEAMSGGGTRGVGDPLAGLELHDWQVAAFGAWAGAGLRGVVEAVTGSGKTRLALAAVRVVLARGGRVLVLVPTVELVHQWVRAVRRDVPGAVVGRLGAGAADDLHDVHVLVATPHSVVALGAGGPPPPLLPDGTPGLLVADEAHRYGAPTWGAALLPGFGMRLALTATYERNDDGVEDVLGPYFGGVVHAYDVADAVRDGVVAGFRLAVVRTALDPAEREQHDALDARVRRLHGVLRERHGFPADPRRLLQRAVEVVGRAGADGGRDDEARVAAEYLSRLRARRDVAAQAAGKLAVLRLLAPGLAASPGPALVFTDTVAQAELAAGLLRDEGLVARTVHGELTTRERGGRMKGFRSGAIDVLVAPRVLDEGVDVPEADVAVVLANFRTRRQLVQRLGRVLRRKPDGRDAAFVLVCASDTAEDPRRGAHRAFLAMAREVATAVTDLDADAAPDAVRGVLAG